MATVKPFENLNILCGITLSVIPEGAKRLSGIQEKIKWMPGYRITAMPCPV
jgi:hypothetical protein